MGRFLQRDPLGFADDVNLYRYVGNNPLTYVDPWGLSAVEKSWWEEWGERGLGTFLIGMEAHYGHLAQTIREYAPGWTKGVTKATRFQSAFQGLAVLQDSIEYTDILEFAGRGDISGGKALAAVGIHTVGMVVKVSAVYYGSVGGAAITGSSTVGLGTGVGAVGGAVVGGVVTSAIVDYGGFSDALGNSFFCNILQNKYA